MSRGKIVGDGAGRYRIGDVLGKGAFSTVYLCTRITDQEMFAVKVISKNDMRKDSELEDALCREFNSMEVIRRSPFITNMIEKLVSPRNYYIVMDLAKGGPLMQVIQQSRQGLHPNRARLYFRQLLMGLTAMHDSNVVHRDIKPENLLLDETKTVLKISDFGFACFSAPSRELFRRCGTLRYTAPEFYTEESYQGRAVDLWAAGVTLYVMLFNQYPFGRYGDSDNTIMDKIRKQEVQFPRKVSGSLEHLMRVMLRKDPAKRWTLDKVKSHAWVMGIDDFTIRIPRHNSTSTKKVSHKHHNVLHTQPQQTSLLQSSQHPRLGTSAGSTGSQDTPPFGNSPGGGVGGGGLTNTSNLFQYNGSGAGGLPALGATPGEEDQLFCLRSSLLRESIAENDLASEEDDEEYITGGMHRRVRSCPVLPSVFFASTTLQDFTSMSTSATGTAVGSPVATGLPSALSSRVGGTVFATVPSGGDLLELMGSPKEQHSGGDDIVTASSNPLQIDGRIAGRDAALKQQKLTAAERNLMVEHLRLERKAQLYKALRLSEFHAKAVTSASSTSLTNGAITGISQSSHLGGGWGLASNPMAFLTASQMRDTFYSDLPSSPNDEAVADKQFLSPQNSVSPQTAEAEGSGRRAPVQISSPLTAAPPMAAEEESLVSHPGGREGSSSATSPPLSTSRGSLQGSSTAFPRFHPSLAATSNSVSTAKNLSRGTSPSSSSGTKQGVDDGTVPNRSPENAFRRYQGPHAAGTHGNSGFSKSATTMPTSAYASALDTSSKRKRIEERVPLYKRLGMVHIRILLNFFFFWVTLLVVGALKVLLDVDARKLPLPTRLREFLERQLAPPFEEEGDSLGLGGGSAVNGDDGATPSGVHHRSASMSAGIGLGAAPSKLRRRVVPGMGATSSSQSSSSFGILTARATARRESPAEIATPRGVAGNVPTPLSSEKLQQVSAGFLSSAACDGRTPPSSSVTPLVSAAASPILGTVGPDVTPDKKRSKVQWSPQQPTTAANTAVPSTSDSTLDDATQPHYLPKPHASSSHDVDGVRTAVGYDGSGTPPPMAGTLPPSHHNAAPPFLEFSEVNAPGAITHEEEVTHEEAGSPNCFERRARELGMRAVASHHENIDDMMADIPSDDEDA